MRRFTIEVSPEKRSAKLNAVMRVSYAIPDNWRGRLFWRLLDVLLWVGGAKGGR